MVGRLAASLAIGYLRSTQLVPMLVAWAFLLLALGLMSLVNFQDTGFTLVEQWVVIWDRYRWLPRLDGAVTPTENGGLTLDDEGFRGVVISLWARVSLILFLLSLAGRALFGVRRRMPLRRKLMWLLPPAALVWLAFAGNYFFGSAPFQGAAWTWFVGFTLACGVVLAVSGYSLTIAHILDQVRDALRAPAAEDDGLEPPPPGPSMPPAGPSTGVRGG